MEASITSSPQLNQALQSTKEMLNKLIQEQQPQHLHLIREYLAQQINLFPAAYYFLFTHLGTANRTENQLISNAVTLEVLSSAITTHRELTSQPTIKHTDQTNQAIIYAGDLLYTLYFDLLIKSSDDVSNVKFQAINLRRMLMSEFDELKTSDINGLTITDGFRRISGQFAQLYALGCEQGAVMARLPEVAQNRAFMIGRFLGMGIGIQESISDIAHFDSNKLTLSRLYLSMPFLFAKQSAIPPTTQDISEIIHWINQNDGIQTARKYSTTFLIKAKNKLMTFGNDSIQNEFDALITHQIECLS